MPACQAKPARAGPRKLSKTTSALSDRSLEPREKFAERTAQLCRRSRERQYRPEKWRQQKTGRQTGGPAGILLLVWEFQYGKNLGMCSQDLSRRRSYGRASRRQNTPNSRDDVHRFFRTDVVGPGFNSVIIPPHTLRRLNELRTEARGNTNGFRATVLGREHFGNF